MHNFALTLEWLGTIFSMIGAVLIANQGRYTAIGWFAFIAANLFSVAFAISTSHYGILTQQIFFVGTSILGLWRTIKNS